MNYFTALPLISAILVFFLGIFVVTKDIKSRLNFTFFLHTVAITIWLFGTFMMLLYSNNKEAIIFWDRFVYIGVVFIPAFMYHFCLALIKKKNDILLCLSYALSIMFLIVSRTDYFIKDLFYYQWGVHSRAQIAHHFFLAYFFIYMIFWFISVYACYKEKECGAEKQKIKYFFFAFLLLFTLGPLAYLPAYGIGIYPFSYISGLIFSIILAYAILRYRLFGMKIILNKTLIYITTFILTAIILYAVFLLSHNFFYSYPYLGALLSVLIFSIIFNPLYQLSKKLANQVFYNGYNPYDNAGEIITQLKKSGNVVELLNNISSVLKKIFGVTKMDLIILMDDEGYRFESINKRQYEKSVIVKLISFFKLCRIMLIKDEIARLPSRKKSNLIFKGEQIEIFKTTNSQLIIPFYNRDLLIGILLIGDRDKSHSYNREDIELLEEVAKGVNELVINLKMRYILDCYTNNK